MESFINSNVRVKGGEIEGSSGAELTALVGIGQEHVQHVRSLYHDLLHQDIQDFDLCLVFEALSEDNAECLLELLQQVITKITTEDPDSAIRKLQKVIATSEDQEYRKDPKFFPKVSRSGKYLIFKFAPITEFRQCLHSASDKYNEELGAELNKKQEINIELKIGKKYSELVNSENLLFDVMNAVLFKLNIHLSKVITKKIQGIISKHDAEMRMVTGLHSLLNNLNIDIEFSHTSSLSEDVLEKVTDEFSRNNRSLKRLLFDIDLKSGIKKFLNDFHQQATENYRFFMTSPHFAVSAELVVPGFLERVIRDEDDY
jgi:hypothetical protein